MSPASDRSARSAGNVTGIVFGDPGSPMISRMGIAVVAGGGRRISLSRITSIASMPPTWASAKTPTGSPKVKRSGQPSAPIPAPDGRRPGCR